MSVTGMNSRMAMAEKLSIPQLQQAIQTGSVPAYVGIPLLQEKMKMQKSMQAMGQQGEQPTVAEQVMQEAEQDTQQQMMARMMQERMRPQMQAQERGPGIDQLPSNLPTYDAEEMGEESYAGGGIVAFAGRDESLVRDEELPYDPVAEGASPAARDPYFVDSETGGRAYIGYRKQKGAGSGTPKGREPILPQQELSALDFDAPVTTLPPTVVTASRDPAFAMEDTAGTTYTPPPKGAGDVGTGQGTRGAGGAPAASQPAQAAQAPAAQTEAKSALDKYAEMLMAERAGSGKAREQAQAMALLQAGLGIMGGTSPNALANIAQGALPATQAYQQEIKGIRAEDAARMKELMGLGISKEKLELEAKKLGISEKRFDQMYELEKQKIGIMGGQRTDAAQNTERLRRDQLAGKYFELLLKQNPMATEAEQDVLRDRARAYAARDTDTAPPSPSNKYAGFSIVK